MVTRIDDIGKYYEELSVKAEQNKAEKEAERVRLVNERAERERAKRETQNRKMQGLLAKAMQKEIDEKKKLADAKQEEHIKELEKQWEQQGDYKTDETIKYESALLDLVKSLPTHLDK